jgi:hypothetical protein
MRNGIRIVAGAAGLLGAGALAFWLNERTVEQPRYREELADGRFSIRRYPPLLVAETEVDGARETALNRGFDRLARYIFARERGDGDRRRIAMTAPVLSDQVGDRWRTRFIMPRRFDTEPLPAPGAGVTAETLPERRMAAITFSGRADDAYLRKAERDLREWLRGRGETATGPAEFAFYNSPFIPGPLRRNEVLLPLRL